MSTTSIQTTSKWWTCYCGDGGTGNDYFDVWKGSTQIGDNVAGRSGAEAWSGAFDTNWNPGVQTMSGEVSVDYFKRGTLDMGDYTDSNPVGATTVIGSNQLDSASWGFHRHVSNDSQYDYVGNDVYITNITYSAGGGGTLNVGGSDTVTVTDNGGQIFLTSRNVSASDTVTVTDNGGQISIQGAGTPINISITPQEFTGPRVI